MSGFRLKVEVAKRGLELPFIAISGNSARHRGISALRITMCSALADDD
jgi:hypothetical protein